MNKTAIQKYVVWARNELIEQVKQRAYQYGINDKGYGDENASVIAGRVLSADEKRQRREFVAQIKENGYQQAVEEVAYTWFNRFIALRFMEINDYLPTHVRVFSDISGGFNPEILKDVLHLDLPGLDKARISDLLNANKTEELYRYLLLMQCNALNEALPEMFEKLGSYTEMLLPNNILKQDSVIARLVKDIDEADWKDAVQIIGWMYQYYNTEPKQTVFDELKKNVKITKEKIPAATQLFTPDWIVRYMVENSLGRLWLESHPNDALKLNWKYYLDEAEQTPEVAERLRILRLQSPVMSPEDIRLIDPCMGSGHILVYAFDVLKQIYESEGYNPRDTAKLILEKNIYGLDIDRRAYQLAYFSLMMKARQYNRRIFTEDIKPQVYHPVGFSDGEEYGSLVKVDALPPKPEEPKEVTFFTDKYETALNVWNFKRLLAQKYDVVVTNPPYMGSDSLNPNLSSYINKHYKDCKADIYTVFIRKCSELIVASGYQAMITQHSWMFLSSFDNFRRHLISTNTFINMCHLGARAFEEIGGEVVQTVAWVMQNIHLDYRACYVRLVEPNTQNGKEEMFFSLKNRHYLNQNSYKDIPGMPVAYWLSAQMENLFVNGNKITKFVSTRDGLTTGNNDLFVRYFWEVSFTQIQFGCHNSDEFWKAHRKYAPLIKGGQYRKWYGNNWFVITYDKPSFNLLSNRGNKLPSRDIYFMPYITWNRISTRIAFRFCESGYLFESASLVAFSNDNANMLFALSFANSILASQEMQLINPTTNMLTGYVDELRIPEVSSRSQCEKLAKDCVEIAKVDWDVFETSWDFKRHPLICGELTVATAFGKWEREAAERFDTLKAYEEKLNRIFIDTYGLQDELIPEVEDTDVTVRRADLGREIRSLISYAVGCMFGRYSLDATGLVYAGGDWDAGKYRSFIPDKDNILPICDDEYFDDDILGRLINFLSVVYGTKTLEENLKFIADALGGKGTPREVIRNYFLNDFYADHCKIYQKRPIYWLFDSGKRNGFKALIYLHRYSRDLLAKLRTDYVHEQQERYRTQLSHISTALNTATGSERARLLKQQDKLSEQLKEISAFEEKVHHLADQNIEIDLDDGVKKNYEIFTDVLAKI